MLPDISSRAPQAANYLTYHFGLHEILPTTDSMRVVVHVTRFGGSPHPDSVVFNMDRYEYHKEGLPLGRDDIRGYEE
jgi:hypothetical protein